MGKYFRHKTIMILLCREQWNKCEKKDREIDPLKQQQVHSAADS